MINKNYKLSFFKINKSIKNTSWPGRLEIVNYKKKKIILDGSHNIDGAEKLSQFLKIKKVKPVVLFGMLNNKKIDIFLDSIRKQIKSIIAIRIPNEKNAYLTDQIKKTCLSLSINSDEVKNINEAIKYIEQSNHKFFLITGSLYLVGKIRPRFL